MEAVMCLSLFWEGYLFLGSSNNIVNPKSYYFAMLAVYHIDSSIVKYVYETNKNVQTIKTRWKALAWKTI